MKNKQSQQMMLAFLAFILIVAGIHSATIRPMYSGSLPLPASGIAFTQIGTDSSIGFIQPDGTNPQNGEFQIPIGLVFDQNIFKQYSNKVGAGIGFDWSPDGQSIAFLLGSARNNFGYPVIMDEDGSIHDCIASPQGMETSFEFDVENGHQIIMTDPQVGINAETRLIQYDLDQCKIVKEIYHSPEGWGIMEADLYPAKSLLAVVLRTGYGEYSRFQLLMVDLTTNESTVLLEMPGMGKVKWSPSGEKLAVIFLPDIRSETEVAYYTPATGLFSRTIRGDSSPAWSPDEKKIAYGVEDEIWVLDIPTWTSSKLTDGSNPSWK
jgi:hypothetical protein